MVFRNDHRATCESLLSHFSRLIKISVTICHFSVHFVTFFNYFKDPPLLISFVEILFLRGPMTLKNHRQFAACPRAEGTPLSRSRCELRLPLQRPGHELSLIPVCL